MKTSGRCLGLLAVLLGFWGVPATVVKADPRFSTGSNLTVNPDFNSGSASSWAGGNNAIVTSLSLDMSYDLQPQQGTAHLYANLYIRGNWGDPGVNSPYYDFLQYQGLQTNGSLQLTEVTWNGQGYQFDDLVSLNLNGWARLSRNMERTWMEGYFNANAMGQGAIPTNAQSSFQIFEPGHPDWLPDWQVNLSSGWLATEGYHLIPEPGTLGLLALGLLASRFRRR